MSIDNYFGFRDNSRTFTSWRRWLLMFGSQYQFVRRFLGGRWELWWVDVCKSFIWHPVTEPSRVGVRPCPWVPMIQVEEWEVRDDR